MMAGDKALKEGRRLLELAQTGVAYDGSKLEDTPAAALAMCHLLIAVCEKLDALDGQSRG